MKFRYRTTWNGKLILQVSERSWSSWVEDMIEVWRDATVSDITSGKVVIS